MSEKIVYTKSNEETSSVFGSYDSNIRKIEAKFDVKITNKSGGSDSGDAIIISGETENTKKAAAAIEYLKRMAVAGDSIADQSVDYVIDTVNDGYAEALEDFSSNATICITNRGKPIKAKTIGQKKYIDAIRSNTVTFGVGPAGTGKTFLAVAMAVDALKSKQVNRIILTRPAVEAGEKLGFLPGDLKEKVDPYLVPIYDALNEFLGKETVDKMIEKGVIEIQAVGAGALNQAIKAVAIARGYIAPTGKDIYCIPAFSDISIEGEERTAIKLIVKSF